ncbi:MAG: ThuA domain-containing protein [Limisphaerales bacterium]
MKIPAPIIQSILLVPALLLASAMVRAQEAPKKILFFSKSSGFEHDMIKRHDGQLSKAEKILADLGEKNNIEFTFTKDGSVFTPDNIANYDAFFFYTTGDLTQPGSDKNPPMTKEGKAALLQAIANGKGFIGTHSATDTFHSPGYGERGAARRTNNAADIDPYIKMIGAEFIIHGSQQRARQICVDKNFPGMSAVPDDFGPLEEWYSLKYFSPDLHVLLVQDTSIMVKSSGGNKRAYDRPNYPSTWAHEYGNGQVCSTGFPHGASLLLHKGQMSHRGRVFYTSMGHRDDIWTNPVFQQVLLGGMNWALGRVEADVTPNIAQVTPQAGVLPPE